MLTMPFLRTCVRGLIALLAVLVLASAVSRADASMLTVSPDGVLLKDGKPYRAIGANIFDAFVRLWEHGDVTYERDFATLEAEGIPFARISATYYEPDAMMQYIQHRDDYLAKLDGVVAAAEKHHVGLIMDLFFNSSAVPDVVHEPRSAWGDPDSKTIAFMREYTRTIVSRYKDSPAVWAWEFGNEYNLAADAPDAPRIRPEINPYFGWPARRTKADDLTTKMILVSFTEFGKAVRELDPARAITTGNSIPVPQAEYIRQTYRWGRQDTHAQFRANLALVTPDPMDMISIHLYRQDMLARFGKAKVTYDDVLSQAMQAAKATKKPLFVGEFASAVDWFGLKTLAEVRADFETKLDAMVDNQVPLAAVWQISSSVGYSNDPLVINRGKGLGWMLDDIRAANQKIADQLASEQRVADLLPQFKSAIQTGGPDVVRPLQKLLASRGFKPGATNGKYGPGTERALTACIAAEKCTAADLPPAK
jgi:hypothetical protein